MEADRPELPFDHRRYLPARTRSAGTRRTRADRRMSLPARRRRAGCWRSSPARTRSAGAWRARASRWMFSQARRRSVGRRRSLLDWKRWAGARRTRSGVLAGEEAEGRPPEVLAGEDEVGRRAEDEGRPPDVLAGKDRLAGVRKQRAGRWMSLPARSRMDDHRMSLPDRTRSTGAWRTVVGRRTSLSASDRAGRRMGEKGRAADACSRGGGDGRGAWWRRLQRRRAGGRGASKWN